MGLGTVDDDVAARVRGGEGEAVTSVGEAVGFSMDAEGDVADGSHAGTQTPSNRTVKRKMDGYLTAPFRGMRIGHLSV